MSDLKVEVLPVSGLSLKANRALKEARPLLVYMFISMQHPCVGYVGTSGAPCVVRLLAQRNMRAQYDFVAYIQMPVGIGYDKKFCEFVEYKSIDRLREMLRWCFLENERRNVYYGGLDPLVVYISTLLMDAVNALVPDTIKFRALNPMFDVSTHTIFGPKGEWVGGLVKNERGFVVMRDSVILMDPFDWHPKSNPGPKPEINAECVRLLKLNILKMRGFALKRRPLVVRYPHTVRSKVAACRFLAGSSEAMLKVRPR
jgi:hypothetical protein